MVVSDIRLPVKKHYGGKMLRRLIIAVALLFSGQAFAFEQGDTYVGLQLGLSTAEPDETDEIENPVGLFRIGIFATPALAIEGRYGASIDDDSVDGVDYDIDRIAGVYALYHFHFGENESSSFYGLFGYSEVDVKGDAPGDSINVKEEEVSYGIGLEIKGFNLEFVQYIDNSDLDASAVSFGYNYYFR